MRYEKECEKLVDDGEMGCKEIVTCLGKKTEKVTLIEERKAEEEEEEEEDGEVFVDERNVERNGWK